MKLFGTIILVLLVSILLSAGCTQPSPIPGTVEIATPSPVMTTTPAVLTPITAAPTSAPQVIVTIVHYIVPTKQWKDSEHHFTFAAPQDLTVTTRRMIQPDGSEGLMYQTDLVSNDGFFITTYPISLN